MKLAYCYECNGLARLEDPASRDESIDPVIVQNWIDRHMHGLSVEEHKGGRLFQPSTDSGPVSEDWEGTPEVREVRGILSKAQREVWTLRDEVKDDALACFGKHGGVSWPDKKCPDYKSDSKRLGRKDLPPTQQRYICEYCPYEETIRVEKRWRAGQYK